MDKCYCDRLEQQLQRRIQEATAAEQRLRSILDHVMDGIISIDEHGTVTTFNPAAERLFGYAAQEVIGQNIKMLMPEPYQSQHDGYLANYLRTGHAKIIGIGREVSGRRKDGSIFSVDLAVNEFPLGGRRHFTGIFHDISEREQADKALQASQRRLQNLVAASPAVLYALKPDGDDYVATWVSENVQWLIGYTAEEALAPDWYETHLHPEERERVLEDRPLLRVQDELSQAYRIHCKDGGYRWILDRKRVLRDAAGGIVQVVGSWSDITERKQLEDQFRQSQKMEAIGLLAGGVAHDFNNLLTIINGYGELLSERFPQGDSTRELLARIVAASDRAAGLTRQLLAFSRKAIIEPRILDLKEVVVDVDKMLRRIIGEDIELTVVTDPEPGTVKADPSQMDQVIMNLVVNARDAMPRGGRLTIEVRSAELDESYVRDHIDAQAGPHVLLAVTDTGCGMDRATMARIFEPFFSTKGEKGTGLGLATVHGIVKQSGGHVAVYSEVGLGTTFKVYLPRVGQRSPLRKSQRGLAVMPPGSETVLLVEDEGGVRALAMHILKSCGYTVLNAADGAEALRIAEQHQGRIDLVVTDVIMPRVSGREVAEHMAALQPSVKILFLSGYTDDAVVRHGIAEADMAFLQKPFSPVSLATKVREVLDS